MRDPAYGEASAASLSRYQTTKAGDTDVDASRSGAVPTYPLQSFHTPDVSKDAIGHFPDEEKGLDGQALQTGRSDFENVSDAKDPKAYKGIYIQSETS